MCTCASMTCMVGFLLPMACWTRRARRVKQCSHTVNRSVSVLDRILLTNDDGIDAPGLVVLEAIAAELAHEVWVVAPEHDQSGVSHAISLHHALRVSQQGERRFGIT